MKLIINLNRKYQKLKYEILKNNHPANVKWLNFDNPRYGLVKFKRFVEQEIDYQGITEILVLGEKSRKAQVNNLINVETFAYNRFRNVRIIEDLDLESQYELDNKSFESLVNDGLQITDEIGNYKCNLMCFLLLDQIQAQNLDISVSMIHLLKINKTEKDLHFQQIKLLSELIAS